MPTINQLPLLSRVSAGDQFVLYTPNNGDARRLPVNELLQFFQQTFASPTLAVNLFVPGTGFNITVPTPVAEQQWMLLQPAGTLASGTITLPLNTGVPDGTELLITTTQTITAFTIALNGASFIYGDVSTLTAGAAVRYRFYQATNSWYNISNETAGLNAAIQAFLNNPTSANLLAAMTDETGTGLLVFNDTPTLITPILGTVTSGDISACTSTSMVMVTPDIGAATGTSLTTTGNQVVSGTGKQGYATGSGGTITQLTDKSAGVILNKTNGSITMDADALAAATTVSFTLTNNTIEAGDILVMNHISGGTAGAYTLNAQSAAGSASINVRNITAGSLSEAIVIRFAVIKAVSA
jgi:hypothetical protein